MIDYSTVIKTKYGLSSNSDFGLMHGPGKLPLLVPDETGNLVVPDHSNIPNQIHIFYWNVPGVPEPTITELEKFAASPEYLILWGKKLKREAEIEVNQWVNTQVIALKILEPEIFYTAMVSNIAFSLLAWNAQGRPEELDPTQFIVTCAEAQAYAESSTPAMTPATLLRLQEEKWIQMQHGFATVVYKRRLALEKIKLATVDETLESVLAAILAELH